MKNLSTIDKLQAELVKLSSTFDSFKANKQRILAINELLLLERAKLSHKIKGDL